MRCGTGRSAWRFGHKIECSRGTFQDYEGKVTLAQLMSALGMHSDGAPCFVSFTFGVVFTTDSRHLTCIAASAAISCISLRRFREMVEGLQNPIGSCNSNRGGL